MQRVLQGVEGGFWALSPWHSLFSGGGCRHALCPAQPPTLGWTGRALALHSPPSRNSEVQPSGNRLEPWPPALLWWEEASSFRGYLHSGTRSVPPLCVPFQMTLLRGWHEFLNAVKIPSERTTTTRRVEVSPLDYAPFQGTGELSSVSYPLSPQPESGLDEELC